MQSLKELNNYVIIEKALLDIMAQKIKTGKSHDQLNILNIVERDVPSDADPENFSRGGQTLSKKKPITHT